jgi:hypothetical protein
MNEMMCDDIRSDTDSDKPGLSPTSFVPLDNTPTTEPDFLILQYRFCWAGFSGPVLWAQQEWSVLSPFSVNDGLFELKCTY